jgi:hypothetical protein
MRFFGVVRAGGFTAEPRRARRKRGENVEEHIFHRRGAEARRKAMGWLRDRAGGVGFMGFEGAEKAEGAEKIG